ncbi:unnamed protein product, partial [Ectocarpus sp. 13 AM-2016]
ACVRLPRAAIPTERPQERRRAQVHAAGLVPPRLPLEGRRGQEEEGHLRLRGQGDGGRGADGGFLPSLGLLRDGGRVPGPQHRGPVYPVLQVVVAHDLGPPPGFPHRYEPRQAAPLGGTRDPAQDHQGVQPPARRGPRYPRVPDQAGELPQPQQGHGRRWADPPRPHAQLGREEDRLRRPGQGAAQP